MFGTRRLERFDLHALRKPQGEDAFASADEPQRAVIDESGVVTESGEHPTTHAHVIPTSHSTLEIATPLVDIRPGEWAIEEPATHPTHGAAAVETPAVAASDPDALRTRLTRKFVSLADVVNDAFRGMAFGEAAFTVELTAPTGMSTGGGKQALLHLRLHPHRPGDAVLLAGTVNPVEQRAELRDYEHIAAWHYVRFERPVPLSRQEWEEFLRRAESVLRDSAIESIRLRRPPELAEELRRRMRHVSKAATIALIVVLTLAAIACARVGLLLLHR